MVLLRKRGKGERERLESRGRKRKEHASYFIPNSPYFGWEHFPDERERESLRYIKRPLREEESAREL